MKRGSKHNSSDGVPVEGAPQLDFDPDLTPVQGVPFRRFEEHAYRAETLSKQLTRALWILAAVGMTNVGVSIVVLIVVLLR